MFVVQGPVNPGGDAFVGRSAELALMDEWLQSSRCVGALLGARQTGKTSLLLRARARLAARYQFAFVNLEAIEGAELRDCFTFIAEELLENVSSGAPPPAAMPHDGRTFMRFLRALADRLERPRLGVLLDEVGALATATGVGLAHTLRAAFTNRHVQPELERFQFVVSGASDLLELTTGRTSPLSNVTEPLYLSDFTAGDSRALLRNAAGTTQHLFKDEVEDAIIGWANGHPYWTQLLGQQAKVSGATTSDAVDDIARNLVASEARNLPHIRRCLASAPAPVTSALDAVLSGENLPFVRSDPRVAHLELLGVVANVADRCEVRNRIYREALAMWRAPVPRVVRPASLGPPVERAAPLRVFVSYAHVDEPMRIELGKHLSVLEREGLVAAWHDRMITPGADWANEIDSAIERSEIVLLLVSADFVHSRYCYEIEMRQALERHRSGLAVLIPVLLRPVAAGAMPFANLQGLPPDMNPVTEWHNRDSAYVKIVEGVRSAIIEFGGRRQ
jgi:hypothetical protein